jgi:hypothetical protein
VDATSRSGSKALRPPLADEYPRPRMTARPSARPGASPFSLVRSLAAPPGFSALRSSGTLRAALVPASLARSLGTPAPSKFTLPTTVAWPTVPARRRRCPATANYQRRHRHTELLAQAGLSREWPSLGFSSSEPTCRSGAQPLRFVKPHLYLKPSLINAPLGGRHVFAASPSKQLPRWFCDRRPPRSCPI